MATYCTPSYTELPSATSVVSGTEIPEWVAAAGREVFSSASGIASSPYPSYTGERYASYDGGKFSADELAGQEILRSGAENYLPYMNRASGIANTLGGGYDSMSREELMGDPYSGASREYLEGDFQGLSADELLGQYSGSSRADLLGSYDGASREDLMGSYQGASREELLKIKLALLPLEVAHLVDHVWASLKAQPQAKAHKLLATSAHRQPVRV